MFGWTKPGAVSGWAVLAWWPSPGLGKPWGSCPSPSPLSWTTIGCPKDAGLDPHRWPSPGPSKQRAKQPQPAPASAGEQPAPAPRCCRPWSSGISAARPAAAGALMVLAQPCHSQNEPRGCGGSDGRRKQKPGEAPPVLVEGLSVMGEVRHSQGGTQTTGPGCGVVPPCPVQGSAQPIRRCLPWGWASPWGSGLAWLVAGGQHKPRARAMALPGHLTCFPHSPIP